MAKQVKRSREQPAFAPATQEGKAAFQIILEEYGLQPPPPPTTQQSAKEFPEDLSQVSDEDLSELLTRYTAMQNYAEYQAVLVNNDMRVMEIQMEGLIREAIPRMVGTTITEKKTRAKNSPNVQHLSRKMRDASTVYDLLKVHAENSERCFQAVSRVIAQRTPMSRK